MTSQGRIADDPELTGQLARFVLDIDTIDRSGGWQQLASKSLVYAELPPSLVSTQEPPYFRKGDYLTLQGTLQNPEPIDYFDYPAFLASQGISVVLWSRQAERVLEKSANHWSTGWLYPACTW